MLKSYEAVIENGQIRWLAEQPEIESARVIVTILEETPSAAVKDSRTENADYSGGETSHRIKRRSFPASIAGKGKTLGDIVSPIVDEEDWECLK